MGGPHYVTAARHRLSARGYVTEFQVGEPPRLLPPEAPAGHGAPGRSAGLAVGIVESLDDPASLGRVQVRLPWRTDGGAGVWARLSNPDAGDGHGTVFVPNPGQEVVVGLLDGDPTAPVVLGCLYNGAQAAPVAIDPDANHVRTVVTPGGHALTLEDGDAAAVRVTTADGHSLVLSDADSELVLTHADSGNAIRVSADGIELTAAQGDLVLTSSAGTVRLDGTGIEGKSTGPSTLESSATFDLKASATLGIKGALVTIN
jgi:uncharacterized protein involved in type VI secretion and phage assembly